MDNAKALVHPTFKQRKDASRFPQEVVKHYTLEYYVQTERHLRYYFPKFYEVPVQSLGDLAYVLEVSPGIRSKTQTLEDFEVLVVGKRDDDWPTAFLEKGI